MFNEVSSKEKLQNIISIVSLVCGAAMLAFSIPDFIRIYQDECQRRILIAEQKAKNIDEITVPEHRTLRRSFLHYVFIEDITSDPCFWLNRNAADYYQVKAIKTLPNTQKTPLYRDRFIKFIKGKK